jgi:hypothetical protein
MNPLLAPRSWEMLQVIGDARRYCDRHDIDSNEEYQKVVSSMAHRAFLLETQPFRDMLVKASILNMKPGTWLIHKDGHLEQIKEPLSPVFEQLVTDVKELVAKVASKYGLHVE